MSDLIKRHRAAAESWRHGEGNSSAALCKFHDETADYIQELEAENEILKWRLGVEATEARQRIEAAEAADEIERLRAMMKKYIRLIVDAEGFDFLSDCEWDAADWETWQEIIAELDSDYAQERAAEEKS